MLDDAVPMLVQGIFNLGRLSCQNFTSYHNYHVSCRQPMLILAKAFAKQSFQCIAFYRPGHLFSGYRKTETGVSALILRNQNSNTGVATSEIVLEYLLEIYRAG